MAHTLSEQKVLKKLGIPSFRHMTKDKIVAFSSMLPRMDPAVAQKALEQFPKFAELASGMVSVYQAVALEILNKNKESVQPFYDACTSILNSLQAQLEKGNLSAEEQLQINNQMIEVAKMISEKDTQNKHFLATISNWVGKATLGLLGIAALALGAAVINSLDNNDE